MGRRVTAAVAVLESGKATYAVGDLELRQIKQHFSKFDVVMGTHLREDGMLRTEMLLEEMEQSGVEIIKQAHNEYSTRYFQKELTLKMPTKEEAVIETLKDYLLDLGFDMERVPDKLHVRHLERMRHRAGYIIPRNAGVLV